MIDRETLIRQNDIDMNRCTLEHKILGHKWTVSGKANGLLKDGSYYFLFQGLTFLKISTHLIELQDKHGSNKVN